MADIANSIDANRPEARSSTEPGVYRSIPVIDAGRDIQAANLNIGKNTLVRK
jgi:hypothetical protein